MVEKIISIFKEESSNFIMTLFMKNYETVERFDMDIDMENLLEK